MPKENVFQLARSHEDLLLQSVFFFQIMMLLGQPEEIHAALCYDVSLTRSHRKWRQSEVT